jgi:hypothetical protein
MAHSVLAKPISRFMLTAAVEQALHGAYGWRASDGGDPSPQR